MTATAMSTVPMTVRLPGEMAEALRNTAFLTGVSANELVKRAVAQYVQQHGTTDAMRAAFEQTLERHHVALDKLKDL